MELGEPGEEMRMSAERTPDFKGLSKRWLNGWVFVCFYESTVKCSSVQTALSKRPIPTPGRGNPDFQVQDTVLLITGSLPTSQPRSVCGPET